MTDIEKLRRGGEVYIGDAVYVSCDGYHLCLRTGDGPDQRVIFLEPNVLHNLIALSRALWTDAVLGILTPEETSRGSRKKEQ